MISLPCKNFSAKKKLRKKKIEIIAAVSAKFEAGFELTTPQVLSFSLPLIFFSFWHHGALFKLLNISTELKIRETLKQTANEKDIFMLDVEENCVAYQTKMFK